MHVFYHPEMVPSDSGMLNEEESLHCAGVLRLRKHDIIYVTDGKGKMYKSEILDASKKSCSFRVLEEPSGFNKHPYHLHLAIAPTKGIERFEWFLEKATEIGIDEITPVISEHSERKKIKPVRLMKIMISAMKQSIKAHLPKLNPLMQFNEAVLRLNATQKFFCKMDAPEQNLIGNFLKKNSDMLVFIGPEGDFTVPEMESAEKNGFRPVTFGNMRLRTETAGVYVCAVMNYLHNPD